MLAGIGIAVIGVTFAYLLPQLAGYGQAWHLVSALSWRWVAILGGCAIFDLATFAPPWQVALPGLRFWPALGVTQASTAASLVVPPDRPSASQWPTSCFAGAALRAPRRAVRSRSRRSGISS